jgi:hypothetical protein
VTEDLPAGQCVCGRPLPADPLSDWACSEPCQSAWLHYQADPEVYPHPREIRAAAEARAAGLRRTVPPAPAAVRDGTEIDVDGQSYVRVGAHWQPAGMWAPLRTELADAAQYRRWCPQCRDRRATTLLTGPRGGPFEQMQFCGVCDHRWLGVPLVGVVEVRGDPWPGIRLRLSDGSRSTTSTFSEYEIAAAGVSLVERIERCWLRLERRLCGGYSDVDQPSEQQRAHAGRRVARSWHTGGMAMDVTR